MLAAGPTPTREHEGSPDVSTWRLRSEVQLCEAQPDDFFSTHFGPGTKLRSSWVLDRLRQCRHQFRSLRPGSLPGHSEYAPGIDDDYCWKLKAQRRCRLPQESESSISAASGSFPRFTPKRLARSPKAPELGPLSGSTSQKLVAPRLETSRAASFSGNRPAYAGPAPCPAARRPWSRGGGSPAPGEGFGQSAQAVRAFRSKGWQGEELRGTSRCRHGTHLKDLSILVSSTRWSRFSLWGPGCILLLQLSKP